MEVRPISLEDEALLLQTEPGLFDHEIQTNLASEFLRDPRHHMLAAVENGTVIGFLSAVDYIHPDKPAELWINEVGVLPTYRNKGVGKALIAAALSIGRELGCRQAWVLAGRENEPAKALYASAGGTASDEVMFSFQLHGG
ncbi:MAG: GNAT family N-acetyltransferase [Anaerolineales bacterium]|jgi:aminoglycoside 6'-N-acetyltransferase I